jgi:hypothetical protein
MRGRGGVPSVVTRLAVASLGASVFCSSGCYTALSTWHWAARRLPRSRAAGVTKTPAGGTRVVFNLKSCPWRENGSYYFDVPADWHSRPVRASIWGRCVAEVDAAAPATTATGALAYPAGPQAMRQPLELDFVDVVQGHVPPRWFDPQHDCGVLYAWGKRDFAAHVFAYDAYRRRWVRLGEIPIDTPRLNPGRVTASVFITPVALVADAACWILGAPIALLMSLDSGGDPCELAGPPPKQLPAFRARDLVLLYRQSRRGLTSGFVRKLAGCGVHAKLAVPYLRQLTASQSERVRLAAAEALARFSPEDPEFYMPVVLRELATGSVWGRRRSAAIVGSWCDLEARLYHEPRRGRKPVMPPQARTQESVRALAAALADGDAHVRKEAALTLGKMGPFAAEAAPPLERLLNDKRQSRTIRRAARAALGRILGPRR